LGDGSTLFDVGRVGALGDGDVERGWVGRAGQGRFGSAVG
jgi:hypothetical protein